MAGKAIGMRSETFVPQDLKNLSEEDIKSMKKSQLQEILRSLGLPKTGKVSDLRNRVLKSMWDTQAKEDEKGDAESGTVPESKSRKYSAETSAFKGKTVLTEELAFGGATGKTEIREEGDDVNSDSVNRNAEHAKVVKYSASIRKRKKWRVTDPAQIAPNCYHRDLFVANFPLVKVVDVPKGFRFPVRDKFEGDVLDAEETSVAMKRWIRRLLEVEHMYGKAETEQQAFQAHFALVESVSQFTRPSREEVNLHNNLCTGLKRKRSYDELNEARKRRKVDEENEDYMGFRIVPDAEEVQGPLGPNRSDGDNEGFNIVTEGAAVLTGTLQEDADVATGFADGIVYVVDERPLQRAAPNSKTLINPERAACVLERKFVEDKHKWNARFQGGFYAAELCLVNIERGHEVPIYVLIMTSSTWSYGILIPEGFVLVRDGEVDINSVPEFERHQGFTGIKDTGLEELQENLKKGTEFYRKNYRDNPHATYADGPMLVGTFYLSSEWFSLPRAERGNGQLPGVSRLFGGLLRVVLGDSVLDFKAEDYEQRWQLRAQMYEDEEDDWFG